MKIDEILKISSGTMANLTGYKDYDRIDRITKRFVQFTIGVLDSSPNEFKDWMEAWNRFEEVYNKNHPQKFVNWCKEPRDLQPI